MSQKLGWVPIFLSCWTICAEGGYVINAGYTDYASSPTPAPLILFLDQRMVKINTTALTGFESALIYNRDTAMIHQLRYGDQTYVEINEDHMNTLQNGVKGVSDFLNEQFGSHTGGQTVEPKQSPASNYQVKYTKNRKTIGPFECSQALVFRDGVQAQEIWFVPWETAGIRKSDLVGLIRLAEFYERLWSMPGANSLSRSLLRVPVEGLLGLTGYPVLIHIMENRKLRLTIQLSPPQKVPLRPAVFSIPEGYSRVWM